MVRQQAMEAMESLALEQLWSADRVVDGSHVLFGDSQNQQERGQLLRYDTHSSRTPDSSTPFEGVHRIRWLSEAVVDGNRFQSEVMYEGILAKLRAARREAASVGDDKLAELVNGVTEHTIDRRGRRASLDARRLSDFINEEAGVYLGFGAPYARKYHVAKLIGVAASAEYEGTRLRKPVPILQGKAGAIGLSPRNVPKRHEILTLMVPLSEDL